MALHAGHRQRVKEKIEKDGFENFAPHEVLEALLFYAVPYRDTNPIAHALLDRGGTLSGVLSLTEAEISAVPGCGEHAALFLSLFGEVASRARRGGGGGAVFDSYESLTALALEIAAGIRGEETHLILLDNRFCLLKHLPVFSGYYASASFRANAVAEPALLYHASMAVLVSTHADRIARPDRYETEATRYLSRSLSLVGVRLLEHYIVSGNICLPVMGSSPMRFCEAPLSDKFGEKGGNGQ